MKNLIQQLTHREALSIAQSESLMDSILSDQFAPEQIGFILAAYEFRSPTGAELAGFANSLFNQASTFEILDANAIDVCGTGGDGLGLFNVSTCVAFIVAAAGITVAKHGNRSVSSKCGSFDVLESLGVEISHDSDHAKKKLDQTGMAFLFAPSFHPVFKKLSALRKNLGVRTFLNALGPLLNPARVKRQLVGVYSPKLLVPMAQAFELLGAAEAMVVHGEDGADELSLSTLTSASHYKNETISHYSINPKNLGFSLPLASSGALGGGSAVDNAKILTDVLQGKKGDCRNMAVLNAAAAFVVAGHSHNLEEGIREANNMLDCGRAFRKLQEQQVVQKELA
jgi:anthranilate phosphoribosyltransferase